MREPRKARNDTRREKNEWKIGRDGKQSSAMYFRPAVGVRLFFYVVYVVAQRVDQSAAQPHRAHKGPIDAAQHSAWGMRGRQLLQCCPQISWQSPVLSCTTRLRTLCRTAWTLRPIWKLTRAVTRCMEKPTSLPMALGGSIGVMLLAVIFIGSTTSNKCHASSNRCLTSSNKEAIKIKFKVACAFFWPFL